MRTASAWLMLSLTVTAACASTRPVILDPSLPHEIARECVCRVYLQSPEGGWVEQDARLMPHDVCQDGAVVRERARRLGQERP